MTPTWHLSVLSRDHTWHLSIILRDPTWHLSVLLRGHTWHLVYFHVTPTWHLVYFHVTALGAIHILLRFDVKDSLCQDENVHGSREQGSSGTLCLADWCTLTATFQNFIFQAVSVQPRPLDVRAHSYGTPYWRLVRHWKYYKHK